MGYLSKLTQWYFKHESLPYWCIFSIDCFLVFLSSLFIYQQFYGVIKMIEEFRPLMATILFYMIFDVIAFWLFHTYSGILRYSSFVDLERVGLAKLTGFAMIMIVRAVFNTDSFLVPFESTVLLIIVLLSTMLMWAVRILVKYLYDVVFVSKVAQRAFIYGLKNGGSGLAKNILNEKPSRFILRGFASDSPDFIHKIIMGVKIYPYDENLVGVMKQMGATVLLVSPQKNKVFRANQEMQNAITEAGIHIYMMPRASEWNKNQTVSAMKEVEIEDLLPRDEIEVDMNAVGAQLENKKILITGSAGSIGSEMVRQIAVYNPRELILIDQAETPQHDIRLMMKKRWPHIKAQTIVGSVCNKQRMEEIFADNRPDMVFHAAAYKHVPMMEDNPGESIHNNVYSTMVIADLAVKYGAKKFVMISTDKAVNPTNVMGCSKRICEIYVQSLDRAVKAGKIKGVTQFVTTRFGNVLGSNGSVIPLFRKQIQSGGPVTVTHPDIIRFFMLIPEACKLVLEAGTKGKGGEIFVFDMGQPVRIVDLARRMILLSGAKEVKIEYTGLREGEKLYEEVLNDEEQTKPTFHEKIKIASVREYDYKKVHHDIEDLIEISKTYNDMKVVAMMKVIVPEYKSNNSKYEVLDNK
jgi:FlaA1/EpsC-like NDP-sugar epimerase